MSLFQSSFQGGQFFEILTAQGANPTSNWKVVGTQKVLDKLLKGNVFICEGSNGLLQIPKDEKKGMFISQPILILQILIPPGSAFSIDLNVLDTQNNKRRIYISPSTKEVTSTPLHVKIPLQNIQKGQWMNLCIDVGDLLSQTIKKTQLKCIEKITLKSTFQLRRAFTMKVAPQETNFDDGRALRDSDIPYNFMFSREAQAETIVFDFKRLNVGSPKSLPQDLTNAAVASVPPTKRISSNSSLLKNSNNVLSEQNRKSKPTEVAIVKLSIEIPNENKADLTRYSNDSQPFENLSRTQSLITTEHKIETPINNRESVASLLESARKLRKSKKSESLEEDEMLIDDTEPTVNDSVRNSAERRSPLYSHEIKPRVSPIPTPGASPRPLRKKSPTESTPDLSDQVIDVKERKFATVQMSGPIAETEQAEGEQNESFIESDSDDIIDDDDSIEYFIDNPDDFEGEVTNVI